FFPATLFVVPAIVLFVRTLRGRALDTLAEERAGLIFLSAWLVPTWVFFELLPTKLSHYILPAYPALALICGWCLVKLMSGMRMPLAQLASSLVFVLAVILVAGLTSPWGLSFLQAEAAGDFVNQDASAVLASWAPSAGMPMAFILLAVIAGLATVIALAFREFGACVVLAVVTSLALGWHIRIAAIPGAIWAQPTEAARIALSDVCALGDDNLPGCPTGSKHSIRAVGYAEPSFVFTTGTDVTIPPYTVLELPDDRAEYPLTYLLNTEDPVGEEAQAALSAAAEANGLCTLRSKDVHALNYSNGDPVTFVALRFDDGPCIGSAALHLTE
ncbi:MAG: glycosyltransferase family 39 protein, partial [Pseudomonadota bacterium]